MLKLDISCGNHISHACKNAALLARHPLAAQAVPGTWYAFGMREDVAMLEFGPWRTPDGAAEDYKGQLFWYECRNIELRDYVRVFSDDTGPGVSFDFNGETVSCEAMPHDDPRVVADIASELYIQWSAKMKAASEAYWTPERKAEEKQRQAEYTARMQARSEAITAAMIKHPFAPTEPEAYAEYTRVNSDGYGSGVVRYGEAWAALMEERIANGDSVDVAAAATQDEADCEGITGFMFGCAVRQLATWWKHGEALRTWHNGKHGVAADVAGVVNPAVLTIGG